MEKKVFDKDEVKMMMRKISNNFKFRRKLDECDGGLVSIETGGKVFAEFLEKKYNLPRTEVFINSYDNEKGILKNKVSIEISRELINNRNKRYMFVDDVYETGMTWTILKAIFPNSYLVVLVNKSHDNRDDVIKGDFVPQDQWVEFEW